jgi:L-threonylcarbamoyladenylate synthase
MSTPTEVLKVLQYEGVVILPTKTVYGLAARADRPEAVGRIYEIKGRDLSKPLVLCVNDLDTAKLYAKFSRKAVAIAKKFWPGPLTLILPAAEPDFFNRLAPQMYGVNAKGEPTLALRCPDIDWRTRTHQRGSFYPVALTSANRSGEEAPLTAQDASRAVGVDVDAMWLGGDCEIALPSTIVTLAEETPKILREGALPLKAFKRWGIE